MLFSQWIRLKDSSFCGIQAFSLLTLIVLSLLFSINGKANAASPNVVTTVAAAINSGGGAVTNSYDGTVFQADKYYSGGSTASTAATISGFEDESSDDVWHVYQTERYGNFSYDIPVANGAYNVILKFAEIYWNAPGKRIFNVSIQGQQVITNLDIFSKAGGKNIAYNEVFPVIVSNGVLNIKFTTVVDHAKVSAIEVVYRALAGASGVVYSDPSGVYGSGRNWYVVKQPAGLGYAIVATNENGIPLYDDYEGDALGVACTCSADARSNLARVCLTSPSDGFGASDCASTVGQCVQILNANTGASVDSSFQFTCGQ